MRDGWMDECRFESNCPLVGSGTIGGAPSVGVFLRDSSPCLLEFRKKPPHNAGMCLPNNRSEIAYMVERWLRTSLSRVGPGFEAHAFNSFFYYYYYYYLINQKDFAYLDTKNLLIKKSYYFNFCVSLYILNNTKEYNKCTY